MRRGRRGRQSGSLTWEVGPIQTDTHEDLTASVLVHYTISPGYPQTYDDPGDDGEIELDLPDGIVLDPRDEDSLIVHIRENHDWYQWDD